MEITAKSADPERFEPEPESLGFDPRPPESSVTSRAATAERQRREALERARALASDGSWALAAPLFRSVIAETTDDVEALRGLGLVALHGNRPAEAVAWLSRARYFAPDSVPLLAELGLAQKRCGLLTDAIASYRRALTVTPHDTALLSNLGRAEREAGRLGSAILAFRRALEIDPRAAGIWSMLSNSLREAGRLTEALRAAQQALRHDPWLREAHLNEGAALHGTGALLEAVVSYFVATTDPELRPAALGNLQVALRTLGERARSHPITRLALLSLAEPRNPAPLLELGRSQAAERPLSALLCFERALSLGPNPSAERDLARLLWDLGRVEPALERLLRAIAGDRSDILSYRLLAEWLAVPNKINLRSQSWQRLFAECPNDATALFNLGVALRRRGYPMQGAALHRRALGLDPLRLSGHVNLGAALSSQGAIAEAIAVYRRALEIEPHHWEAASNLLFSLHLDRTQTPESIFEEHRRIGALLSAALPALEAHVPARPLAGRRLRIGYVSPDFRSHPVAHFLEPVLREHDRGAFEIFCYSDVEHPDEVTARLSGMAAHFIACAGFPDQKLRERIVADGIDILVDLAGHTGRNRLPVFASKPCPVQVAWLGYFDTTGISAVDYRIADEPSLPASAERYFTERVVRLPRSANCFLPPAGPEPSPPPCLTRSGITFGCFNNPAKIGRDVVKTFARVLHAVPGSRLLLKYLAFNDPGMRTHYRAWFKEEGILAERIAFEGPSSLERFFESFSRVDIALDPFPYSGETTALHTLWMGVPLVALEGPTLVQRLASRVLHIAGLTDWIAHDEGEYVRIALDLAGDFERLERLRRELRPRLEACPLLDHEGVTRELEAAYRELWQRACVASETAPGSKPVA